MFYVGIVEINFGINHMCFFIWGLPLYGFCDFDLMLFFLFVGLVLEFCSVSLHILYHNSRKCDHDHPCFEVQTLVERQIVEISGKFIQK